VIAVGSDDQWQACLRALELGELAADRELATNRGRLAHRDRVIQVFERVLRTRTAPEWLARLEAERVPSGVVKSVLEALADVGHTSPITGLPSSVGGRVRLPPPKLDEHGDAVRAFGWQAFQRLASL
jgi:crotonobetainyl-CoA:carnitine CoA-transferase CaiB-like acyl-CoA transferase